MNSLSLPLGLTEISLSGEGLAETRVSPAYSCRYIVEQSTVSSEDSEIDGLCAYVSLFSC